jgi:hypothetical protein
MKQQNNLWGAVVQYLRNQDEIRVDSLTWQMCLAANRPNPKSRANKARRIEPAKLEETVKSQCQKQEYSVQSTG